MSDIQKGALADARDRLRAYVASIERDAARYRWLRNNGDGRANAIAAAVAEGDNEHGGEYVSWLYGDELDAAIDAAISKGGTP
jgi:hypothetical protein